MPEGKIDIDPSIEVASLEIGDPLIDEEHRRLFRLMHKLMQSSSSSGEEEEFSDLLSQLGLMIFNHFNDEEDIIKSLPMPQGDVDAHIQAHKSIIERYAMLSLEMMQGTPIDRGEALSMVQDWVLNHLHAHDLKLRPFIAASKGRTSPY